MSVFNKCLIIFLVLFFVVSLPISSSAQQSKAEELIKFANVLIGRSQHDSAIQYCNAAIALGNQNAWAHNVRGIAYYNKGKYDQAISDYGKAIELAPNYTYAYFNRGKVYHDKGDYDQAISDYNQAIELDPKYSNGYHNRGKAYSDKGNYDQAIIDYNKAIELDPKNSYAYVNRGFADKSNGNFDQAIIDYNKAIEIDPKYIFAYNNRGIAYSDKGDYDQAIIDYNKVIEIDPMYAYAYNNKGFAYKNKSNYDLAISEYSKAIKLDPKFVNAYINRGVAFDIKGKYDQAISDYSKATELDPKNANAYNNRGVSFKNKGNYDQAISDYSKAIEIDPKYVLAYDNRGFVYKIKGNHDQAIIDYSKAVEINPKHANAYNNRGNEYKDKGNYDQAISDYKSCIENDPINKYALINILPCFIRQNRFTEAAAYYNTYKYKNVKSYIESDGWQYYKLYLNAAIQYVSKSLYKPAIEEIKKAEESYNSNTANNKDVDASAKSSYADVLALKGYVLEKLKQIDDAEAAYSQALVINNYQPDVKEAFERLRGLQVVGQRPAIEKGKTTTPNLDLPLIQDDQHPPKYYAILIAEKNYQDAGIPSLQKPVEDAMKLKSILQTKYTFPPSNIDTMFNRSREDILISIAKRCNTLTENDNLLIFYSGHGTTERDDKGNVKGYLVPTSARKGNAFTYISFNDIVSSLGNGNTKHILLILDACYSGSLFIDSRTKEIPADAPIDVQLAYQRPSRKAIASGNLEPVPDNSVFMYYMMKRLEENKSKYLLASYLFNSLLEAVIHNSHSLPEHVVINATGHEGGDFVFIKR